MVVRFSGSANFSYMGGGLHHGRRCQGSQKLVQVNNAALHLKTFDLSVDIKIDDYFFVNMFMTLFVTKTDIFNNQL